MLKLLHASGPWFNIKMSYRYKKSHCGNKTILRPSYLHNRISYSGKMTSLYWIRALSLTFTFTESLVMPQSTTRVPLVDLAGWLPLTLGKSPILSGRKVLCTTAMQYNPYVSEGKTTVSIRFISKIHKILSTYIFGCWQIQSDLRNFHYLKKRRMWGNLSKSTYLWQRHFAWRLVVPYTIINLGHHWFS